MIISLSSGKQMNLDDYQDISIPLMISFCLTNNLKSNFSAWPLSCYMSSALTALLLMLLNSWKAGIGRSQQETYSG